MYCQYACVTLYLGMSDVVFKFVEYGNAKNIHGIEYSSHRTCCHILNVEGAKIIRVCLKYKYIFHATPHANNTYHTKDASFHMNLQRTNSLSQHVRQLTFRFIGL